MNKRNASIDKVMLIKLFTILFIMSIGAIIYEHDLENRKTIRAIESLNKKLINARAALCFNQHCDKNNLLPGFTYIYVVVHMKT